MPPHKCWNLEIGTLNTEFIYRLWNFIICFLSYESLLHIFMFKWCYFTTPNGNTKFHWRTKEDL